MVDPEAARVEDLLQAPIVFFNGHEAPDFSDAAKKKLRDYVDQGGFIFADACCGRDEFDRGFRDLMKDDLPRAPVRAAPAGRGPPGLAREASPHARRPPALGHRVRLPDGGDLLARGPVVLLEPDGECRANPAVIKAIRVGQNVVDYATGREMPADKLATREVVRQARSAEAGRCGSPS